MWEHSIDMLMSLDESIRFVRGIREVQEFMIKKNNETL